MPAVRLQQPDQRRIQGRGRIVAIATFEPERSIELLTYSLLVETARFHGVGVAGFGWGERIGPQARMPREAKLVVLVKP